VVLRRLRNEMKGKEILTVLVRSSGSKRCASIGSYRMVSISISILVCMQRETAPERSNKF
jgi:hypothetical protein